MVGYHIDFLNDDRLPGVIQPQGKYRASVDHLIELIHDENELVKEHLLTYGALLLRGFHVNSAEQFSEVIRACSLGPMFNYDLCPIPRTKIKEGIYTSINAPSYTRVPMHNEKSYHPIYPSHIFFNCIEAPKTGGSTPLVDAHKLWLSLPEALQEKLYTKKVMYRTHYYGEGIKHKLISLMGGEGIYRTWANQFNTRIKNEVERLLNEQELPFRWALKAHALITELILPAYRYHPLNKKIVWFNQVDHKNDYYNTYYSRIKNYIRNPIFRFIQYASWWFVSMERCCQAQLIAESTGRRIKKIKRDVALKTAHALGSPRAGWMNFQPLLQDIMAACPELLD